MSEEADKPRTNLPVPVKKPGTDLAVRPPLPPVIAEFQSDAVALEEVALVDQHTVRDLRQHGSSVLVTRPGQDGRSAGYEVRPMTDRGDEPAPIHRSPTGPAMRACGGPVWGGPKVRRSRWMVGAARPVAISCPIAGHARHRAG